MPAAFCKPFVTFAALVVLAGSVSPAVGADFAVPVEGVGVDRLVVDPALMAELPGLAVTHGCVRLGAKDLEAVWKAAPVGTKVYLY